MTNDSKYLNILIRCIVFTIMLAAVLLAGMACHRNDVVTYEVTGDADTVNIRVTDDDGIDQEFKDVSLPWRAIYADFSRSYVYLYAWNTGEDGTITATIYVNGQVFKSLTVTGPGTNVTLYGDK